MESSTVLEKAKTGDKPPRIVDHAQSQIVNDGDAVTLSCRYVFKLEIELNDINKDGNNRSDASVHISFSGFLNFRINF